ncbi:MAG: TIGR03560 family F420-dependent LLM class oxidoreductase [Dehalococcoidia bacterium]|nr:TIGR03560 family F420-dependent LLM class oxidoreductase [Dehalococcoidia bacterium]
MAIKFGVQATQSGVTWEELLSLWRELDRDSNFDHLWLMDHFVTGAGTAADSSGPCMEGWTALAALAQATERVRLGILVTGNTYRHPAVLAKMATTVDHISGGRLEFGLGAAWHAYEHQAFAIPFHTTGERLERLEEAAQVIKLLWTQPRPKFEGRYYQLDEPPYNPPNVQQPHPPILIGGSGERRTLRTVARYADATNVQGTPEQVRRKFEVLEGHCREAGRDYSEIRRTVQLLLFLTDDPAFQQRVVQGVRAFRGGSEEDARRSVLLGSVEDVKAQVREFADAGVQEIIVAQFPRTHRESLLRFSREVIPAFR